MGATLGQDTSHVLTTMLQAWLSGRWSGLVTLCWQDELEAGVAAGGAGKHVGCCWSQPPDI